jgi:nucleotide-binding universal stress UspA family protein
VEVHEVMTMNDSSTTRVLAGYDGSLAAGAAIEACAMLIPAAHAWIGHVWTPPFADQQLRHRLWRGTGCVDEFVAAVEREGRYEADRIAAMGAMLARAAGWTAEPFVIRGSGGEGFLLTEMTRTANADLLLLGARGLQGAKAVLGSASDMAVHYATRPVIVMPYPMLAAERAEVLDGPVLVGWDGSPGADAAVQTAARLLPGRRLVLAAVDVDAGPPALPAGTAEPSVLRLTRKHEHSSAAVADALISAARENAAAVVVVGSRGRSAAKEILLGSVAMRTLHRAHRLVMVVPQPPGTTDGGASEPDCRRAPRP